MMVGVLLALFALAIWFTIFPHRIVITHDELDGWRCWIEPRD
jgi:hypothetical protein